MNAPLDGDNILLDYNINIRVVTLMTKEDKENHNSFD